MGRRGYPPEFRRRVLDLVDQLSSRGRPRHVGVTDVRGCWDWRRFAPASPSGNPDVASTPSYDDS